MTYQETIDYLYASLPMFSRIGQAAYKADLNNTIDLCNALDNPQEKFKSIHIAGTNGKGSVSHMLASILQEAGYKTGLYTSPHLKDLRERIRINGKMVPESFITEFVAKMKTVTEKIKPSFFEWMVAMAFQYFHEERVDIAVIETGLGGRLDSTNVIHPELSVITQIGMDHMNLLGDTIEKIAKEKAGIIKSRTPIVIGETLPATKIIFEDTAWEKEAPVFFASELRKAINWYWIKHELIVEVDAGKTDHDVYKLDLPGVYQVKNLITVLECCHQLQRKGWSISNEHISRGLAHVKKNTGLHGRWDVVHTSPLVVLDVAHNVDGIKQVLQQVEVTDHHQLHIVLGMVSDKDVETVLKLLPKTATYYFTRSSIPRALPEDELQSMAGKLDLKGHHYPDVNAAINAALQHAHETDMILVCGSVFLVGEVNRF